MFFNRKPQRSPQSGVKPETPGVEGFKKGTDTAKQLARCDLSLRATAVCVWSCVCPGHGDAVCRSPVSPSRPHRLSMRGSAGASQAWCDAGMLLDKCVLEALSFLAFPFCIRSILIRKGKISCSFSPGQSRGIRARTQLGTVFLQTTSLRIQFRAILLLH